MQSCQPNTRTISPPRSQLHSCSCSTVPICSRRSKPRQCCGPSKSSWRLEKTVKFHFFHLMPYPDLPDEFRQRYHGVWVDVPAALYDPTRGHAVYNEYLDE